MTSKKGFIQLLYKNTIVAQLNGTQADIPYIKDNVWIIQGGMNMVFTETSDWVQPDKFFRPIHKTEIISVFDIQPENDNKDIKAIHHCSANLFSHYNINELKEDKNSGWNAFVGHEFVGTSEY